MKSPSALRKNLKHQWENNDLREARLVDESQFPITLSIGKPTAKIVANDLPALTSHIKSWRAVKEGTVIWQDISYRATSEAITVPTHWEIPTLQDWIKAAHLNPEASQLLHLLDHIDPRYHTTFIRNRSLWKNHSPEEMIKLCTLVDQLEPRCAGGAPLRAISLAGIDTKFFERHRHSITRLLDLRFDGEATHQGLETFLDAWKDSNDWLLLADLDGQLLPFSQIRVRSQELREKPLPSTTILIVENEKSLHQLPPLEDTIAILGAGLNLNWLASPWIQEKQILYWGDIDTWGLTMLSQAREHLPHLTPILMTLDVFQTHAPLSAVPEPASASPEPPPHLSDDEKHLYQHLQRTPKNRLEQEFLPKDLVQQALTTSLSNK